ncbi:hypothetical protein ABB02_00488 [Clostridiaceae bacterium JG1575]|nr:hypothetical protein ABB02_00488 [Clostridiaceae bacterium JG1575]
MKQPSPRPTNRITYQELAHLILLAGVVAFVVMNITGFFMTVLRIITVLAPLILGILFAFILNLPMTFLERHLFRSPAPIVQKIRRPLSLALSVILVIGILVLVSVLVIPQSIQAVQQISTSLPETLDRLLAWLKEVSKNVPALQERIDALMANQGEMASRVIGNLGTLAGGFMKGVTDVLGGLFNGVLALVFSLFILGSKERLLRQLDRLMQAYMSPQKRGRTKYYLGVVSETFSQFISGQVTEAVVMGIITTLLLMLFRFPYATVVGPIIGLTCLIPMLGAIIGGVLGFLLILTANPTRALLFVPFITILQQLDGSLLYPRIVGNSVGLPGIWVFFAVTGGGALFGFMGTFLGVPTMAALYKLGQANVKNRLRLQREGALTNYQILKVPKGKTSVRLNEPTLLEMANAQGEGDTAKKEPPQD